MTILENKIFDGERALYGSRELLAPLTARLMGRVL